MCYPSLVGFNSRFFFVLSIVFCLISLESSAAELSLSGFYQGRNLFVQNPLALDKKAFCTDEVYVNDQKVMSNIRSSAYEIDLSSFTIDDAIKIRITYKDDCSPKILNPQVLRSGATFQFISFSVTREAVNWTTSGEQPNSLFFVEQYMSNNWLAVKTVYSKGTGKSGVYSVAPSHLSGINRYRIKAQDNDGKIFYTREVNFNSVQETVTFYPKSVTDKITLSHDVPYEVLNSSGKIIRKGKGKEILLKGIKTGVYYLNIDSRTEKFYKK
ncbi:MAG: hypothetical protein V4714_19780 [Bacteroidota bacterium]